jgi:hypothetical protein
VISEPDLVLGEADARDPRAGDARRVRERLTAASRAHPSAAMLIALVGLAAVSSLFRVLVVSWVHGPQVFLDALGYQRMALSFAHTGHFSLFGKTGLAYSPLYPVVLSPIYGLTSSVHAAYEWAKVENAVLISLSVFPLYAVARSVLARNRAFGVAALSLIAPLMLYSGFAMSESLAYTLFLVAIWAMLRTVRNPSLCNDGLLLAAIALASAARLQQVALIPAALTAILLVALLRRDTSQGRLHEVRRAISQHWLLFGLAAAGLVVVLAGRAMSGGDLPLAGRYANVGTAHASPLRVIELAVQHLAELDFAVGVIPFAAALLAGYGLVRAGFPRKALVFASVAVAATFWILLEVAFDAAAFDSTVNRPNPGPSLVDLPRIHERYLIYVMPLFFVALVAALPLLRAKIPARRHLAIAGVAAALPVLIPLRTVINNTSSIDSFALQAFGTVKSGAIVPIAHPTLAILFLSALIAFGYFRAAVGSAPTLAVFVTAVALLGMGLLELGRQVGRDSPAKLGLPANASWVDRVVGKDGDVSLVGGAEVRRIALEETAYWNLSVSHLYNTCKVSFGTDFGEQPLTSAGPDGTLTGPSGAIHARYAVVPTAFGIHGRVLARNPAGKLVLIAPPEGMLRVPAERRSALSCPTR